VEWQRLHVPVKSLGVAAFASGRDNSNKETACINAPAGALGVVTDTLKDGTPVALLPSAPQWLQRTSAVSEDPVSGGQTHTADRQTDPCGASFWRAHSLHSSVMFAHHIGASVESLLTGCEPKLCSIQAAHFPLCPSVAWKHNNKAAAPSLPQILHIQKVSPVAVQKLVQIPHSLRTAFLH